MSEETKDTDTDVTSELAELLSADRGKNAKAFDRAKDVESRLDDVVKFIEAEAHEKRVKQHEKAIEVARQKIVDVIKDEEFPLLTAFKLREGVADRVEDSIRRGKPVSARQAALEIEESLRESVSKIQGIGSRESAPESRHAPKSKATEAKPKPEPSSATAIATSLTHAQRVAMAKKLAAERG